MVVEHMKKGKLDAQIPKRRLGRVKCVVSVVQSSPSVCFLFAFLFTFLFIFLNQVGEQAGRQAGAFSTIGDFFLLFAKSVLFAFLFAFLLIIKF
jgi:hypothetical protein